MNRPYKIPGVVGGRRAQKEEVFSSINLSLRSFVLRSGGKKKKKKTQLRQQPVLILPNIMYHQAALPHQ